MKKRPPLIVRWSTLAALLSAACALQAASNSYGATVLGGYTLNISESDRFLDALGTSSESMVKMEEGCINPYVKMMRRNMPAFRIDNSEDSEGEISSFTIEIKEDGFIFGNSAPGFENYVKESMYNSPNVTITGAEIQPGSGGGDSQKLTVFFDGLTPGETAIFRLDLDAVDPDAFLYPDFREVLHGMSFDGIADVGTPGEVSAEFEMGNMSSPTQPVPLPVVQNDTDVINARLDDHNNPDRVTLIQSGGAVPEPSTGAMALLALAAGVYPRRR